MPSWYLEWVSAYLAANDANTAPNQAMLKTWWPAFAAMVAEPAELHRAIYDVLALTNRPIRTADHFSAIRTSILSRRAENAKSNVADYSQQDRGQCVLCGNTGIIVVPHPRHCSGEGWRPVYTTSGKESYPTAGVLCSCSTGRRAAQLQASKDEHQRAMTIETYEITTNGHWREQMAQRREAERTIREVEASCDARALVKNLAQRVAA